MNEKLIHDVTLVCSRQILEVIGNCLREEERKDAYEEIYACVKAGLECFEIQSDRFQRLLKPGNN
jgi:hypothetical protein